MINPDNSYFDALERVFGYLKGIKFIRPTYRRGTSGLVGYVNSDWLGNRVDRRSITGYIFKYQGGPISWSFKRQDCVALLTFEAEYVAVIKAIKEAFWYKSFFNIIISDD